LRGDESRLDGLAQADLVGEDRSSGQRVLEGEESGVDLMRVQVDSCLDQRAGQLARVV
jgi:hypothetical protein